MLSLNLDTLCTFTSATPSSRNLIEGQKVINSGLIIMCGASSKTPANIELYALCLQTSALTVDPHTITGTLIIQKLSKSDLDDECIVRISKMACSCKAGASQSCKHIVAVLLYCNRCDLNKLELISSTDKKCLWKKHKQPVLEQFQAQPTKTFCCINQERLPILLNNVQESIRNRLIHCNENTALSKHHYRGLSVEQSINECNPVNKINIKPASRVPLKEIQNNVTDSQSTKENNAKCVIDNAVCCKELDFLKVYDYQLPNCCKHVYESKIICKDVYKTAIETKDCKTKWIKERKFRITGSKCHSIYTYSKNDWSDKARKYFWAKEFTNKYVRHGNKYESVARNKYIKEKNVFVEECGLIVSKTEPWLAYSPDGIVIKNNNVSRLLEIKCPFELENTSNEVLAKQCIFVKEEGSEVIVKKRHQYYSQVQCGMALLNLKNCDFVVYSSISDIIKIIGISYDRVYVQDLLMKLKRNYFEKMLHEICNNIREN